MLFTAGLLALYLAFELVGWLRDRRKIAQCGDCEQTDGEVPLGQERGETET